MIRPPTHACFLGLIVTGYQPADDFVLEVGIILTDIHLTNVIHEWATPIGHPDGLWSKQLERREHLLNRYVKSGLVGDLVAEHGMAAYKADRELAALVEPIVRPGAGVLVADSRERELVTSVFPRLNRLLASGAMDLTHIRLFLTEMSDRDDLVYDPEVGHHRAADVARNRLAEARHYQQLTQTNMETTG